MSNRKEYYFWILSLTVVLMLLILAAQVFTTRNINGLKTGNQEAAVTFTINNRLQEIVNTSAVLEARLINNNIGSINKKSFSDSLTVLGYNASVLEKLNLDDATRLNFSKLNRFISKQVDLSFKLLEAKDSPVQALKKNYFDSLARLSLSDSIYIVAVSIEHKLENKLKQTFDQNTATSQKLSTLNKIFALIAIAAILILGTIIINTHLRQVSLIEALEKANEEVKQSAMVKEQFLANMSHELRTPLNAIKGFSRLIQQTDLNDEQRKFSDIIENSSNNLLHLVNDILDISKIEAGKMKVEQKEFDLKRMLHTLEQMFLNTARDKNLDFNCRFDEDVPQHLYGDPDRVFQILTNLVSNAFKFTSKGFVNVQVSKISGNENTVKLEFRIEDSGVGIATGKRDLIFERFQQIKNPQDSVNLGTGLGLAIVKNLSQILGGAVSVSSHEGQGSLFTVSLPFSINSESLVVDRNLPESQINQLIFKGAKVLVAEDNEVNQLLILQLLNRVGIEPVLCENGEQILSALKKESFDLLLLDIQMPLLNGYDTALAIRKAGSSIPIVAMTAYVLEAEKEKCKMAGMDSYLAKPLDEQQLKNILRKYLPGFILDLPDEHEEQLTEFLVQLSGGDKQMANLILNQVRKEIPAEIKKLENIIDEKNIKLLPAYCHHLTSTISAMGNETAAMNKNKALQKLMEKPGNDAERLKQADELRNALKKMNDNLYKRKTV